MTRYPSIIYVRPAILSRRIRQRRGSANVMRVRDWEAKIRADARECQDALRQEWRALGDVRDERDAARAALADLRAKVDALDTFTVDESDDPEVPDCVQMVRLSDVLALFPKEMTK